MRARIVALMAAAPLLMGSDCFGGGGGSTPAPTVTIGDINCDRSAVAITAQASASQVSPPPGSQHTVAVSVTVKCDGVGVEGVSVSAGYWWGVVAQATTGVDGVATFPSQAASGAIPASATVDVTVTPTQGDPFSQTVTVTIQ